MNPRGPLRRLTDRMLCRTLAEADRARARELFSACCPQCRAAVVILEGRPGAIPMEAEAGRGGLRLVEHACRGRFRGGFRFTC